MENDCELTITHLAPLIRRKKISPVELTKFCLERIAALQPTINAYITITADTALAQAKRAESEIANGRYRGILHGIPVSFKDLIFTRNVKTTAGSGVLKKHIPKENAAIVDSLLNAGCILLGKTNMHEFAFGSTNVSSHYGPVRNPWDTTRISGGSSGGSAAAVVTAQAIASFGTDTGGSIRIPSAACGCVGFKPTYGRMPMNGIIPLSGTLDHAGPLSRCVLDAAFLFDAASDPNRWDCDAGRAAREIRRAIRSFAVGMPRQYFFDHIHPGVRECVLAAARVFEQLGADIREVDLKGMEQTARLAADITGCEASAFHEKWLRTKSRDYGKDVRQRLQQSRSLTAAAYIRSMRQKAIYSHEFEQAMESVRLLLAPTLPLPAPPIKAREVTIGRSREAVRVAMLRLTRPGNLTGLQAISIPCGFFEGLPVGLQLIGRRFDEASVLRAAYAYECATPWHEHFPVVRGSQKSGIRNHP
jgi:aspartyl-tRNA(Asn)/glutamyl-tRNA(Gln) amidotransferase subunit A